MLAVALARMPELLVMDEPVYGLDESERVLFWEQIAQFRSRRPLAVLFTTRERAATDMVDARGLILENGGIAV